MSQELLRHVQKNSNSLKKVTPPIEPGNRVKVHQKIIETGGKDGAKERIQLFEGLVIAVSSGNGADATFTVRKVSGGIGVEKIFPLHSKNIAQIEILTHSKIRRSKLYFMRERTGKSARLREGRRRLSDMPIEEEEKVSEKAIEEAVEAAAEEVKEEEKSEEATE